MRKIAFLFPGQGSQSVGMGASLAERYSEARSLYEEAKNILGFDLLPLCQSGPEEKLRETEIAQPALYVTGVAASVVLRAQGIEPEAVAGHSVGEYAALAAANVFNFKEGLELVRQRGQLMKTAGAKNPGGMVAVLGLSAEALQSICNEASQGGVCIGVNLNSPEQTVVAGDRQAIDRFIPLAQAKGAKRVIPLNVAGAFHSPLMREAALEMENKLNVPFAEPSVAVGMNVDGQLHANAADVHAALARQLDSPVQWVKTIQTMRAQGFTDFVECGAGRVLSGLVRRIDKGAQVFLTESVHAVEETVKALETARRATS